MPLIEEWRPLSLDLVNGIAILALGVALVGLGARPRRHLGRIALCLFMSCLAARHGRFEGLAGLFVIGTALGPLGHLAVLRRPAVGRTGTRLLAAALAGAVCLLAAVPFLQPQAPLSNVAPAKALAAARSAGLLGSPVYNSYNFGGFLIGEGVPTFVDGRTDQLFLGGFLKELTRLTGETKPQGFLDFVERHGARWAIVKTADAEAAHFAAAAPRWRPVYRDAEASVFALAP